MDRRLLDGLPFWSCCDRRDNRNEMPFPLSHMRNLDGSGLPICVISDSSGDDGMSIDDSSDELASLRHIEEAWDTRDEENALQAMLDRYG